MPYMGYMPIHVTKERTTVLVTEEKCGGKFHDSEDVKKLSRLESVTGY